MSRVKIKMAIQQIRNHIGIWNSDGKTVKYIFKPKPTIKLIH